MTASHRSPPRVGAVCASDLPPNLARLRDLARVLLLATLCVMSKRAGCGEIEAKVAFVSKLRD
ncbi:hypothetical protein [Sorangium cellulosum]|uniref:hypothetical protein n=1 Tax=Sorangium TaxID=39643 RepID=UPI000B14F3B3|nr:hypothetical protein [Sorangium cellulosum]